MNLIPEILNIIEQGAYQIPARELFNRLEELKNQRNTAKRRWFWELLQNAKDSISSKQKRVSIKLFIEKNELTFLHNGDAFSVQDVINLIRPDSSKYEFISDDDLKLTGRFGTGFIATHVLSKIINVEGICKNQNKEFKKFSVGIDRTGKDKENIAKGIKESIFQFSEAISRNKIIPKYTENQEFDSIFKYKLDNESYKIAIESLPEIINLLPYVLVFNPLINQVEIRAEENYYLVENKKNDLIENLVINQIQIISNNESINNNIALLSKNNTQVSFEILKNKDKYSIQNLSEKLPKLFCSFPLVGTEKFNLPIIINSTDFNPKTERNGIWLNEEEIQNKKIFDEEIVELYFSILDIISDTKWSDVFNLLNFKMPDLDDIDNLWYKEEVLNVIRTRILTTPLVDCIDGTRKAIDMEDLGTVDFPSHENKKIRVKIWELCSNDPFFILPLNKDIDEWHKILWDSNYNLTIEGIAKRLSDIKNMEDLSLEKGFNFDKAKRYVFDAVSLIVNEDSRLLNQYRVLPNQLGIFKKKDELHLDNVSLNLNAAENLKDILKSLGDDCRNDLLSKDIEIEHSYSIDEEDIAAEISKLIKPILNSPNDLSDEEKDTILFLLEWMEENPYESKNLFIELYNIKDRFYTSTLNNNDKSNLVKILRNKNGFELDEISEIVNNAEFSEIIRSVRNMFKEKEFLTDLGTQAENVFAKVFSKNDGFEIQHVYYGQDFIIKIKNSNTDYLVEIKSTTKNSVSMTSLQAHYAVSNPERYALCIIPRNNETISESYFIKNARFIINIGLLLKSKVETLNNFEVSKNNIDTGNEDIQITFEGNLNTKFNIKKSIWDKGLNYDQFVKYLQQEL
jgi:hypothetical protein